MADHCFSQVLFNRCISECLVVLVKPQFEGTRPEIGKGGVVRAHATVWCQHVMQPEKRR